MKASGRSDLVDIAGEKRGETDKARYRRCRVGGCGGKHLARGLCRAHYLRMYRHGSLDTKVTRGVPAIERVLVKCVRTDNGCLIYTGRLTKKGYAHVRGNDGRMKFAHVLVYEHEHGTVPEGLEIDHLCRNRACCEETHLEAVKHAVNVRRGRAGHDHASRPRNCFGKFARVEKELV